MSDLVIINGSRERKRTWTSLAVAVGVHAGLILLLALAVDWGVHTTPVAPITIDVQVEAPPVAELPAVQPAVQGGGGALPARAAVARPAAAPTAPSGASDYVIPTPRAAPTDAARPAAGPAFQEAGGRTGAAASLPSMPSDVPAPTVAPVQTGKGAGAGAAAGSGAASSQRSGTGVAVTGSPSSGSLDMSQLDKAIAARSAAKPGPSGATTAGTGGSGGGAGGGAGAGSGGGTGSGAGAPPYSVIWDRPKVNVVRTLISSPSPHIPAWVGAQGLPLSVDVNFTLGPDGVMAAVSVWKSSGYADVDSALIDAIRSWRFSAANTSIPVIGHIHYLINIR